MDYAQIYPCIALTARGRIGQWWIHKEYKTYRVVTKYYVPTNPQTDTQQANRQLMTDAVTNWQGFNDETKNYYNELKRPTQMSGYNRYIQLYLLNTEPSPVGGDFLVQEIADKILQEDGGGILWE